MIRCVYSPVNGVATAPDFPATDQHPDAVRYLVGLYYVDAIGAQPTQAEIDAMLGLDAAGVTKTARIAADEVERQSCKIDAAVMPLVNMDKAAWISWATTNFPTLTAAEKNRLGQLFWVVSVGVRRSIRNGS